MWQIKACLDWSCASSPDKSVLWTTVIISKYWLIMIWCLLPPSGCTVLPSSVPLRVLSVLSFIISSGLFWCPLDFFHLDLHSSCSSPARHSSSLCLLNLLTISFIPSPLFVVFSSFPCHLLCFIIRSQMTSLMLAARDGNSKVINLLVSHGAEVDAQDGNGYTVSCSFSLS